MIETINNPKGIITIGVVGKYVQHQDAYKSIREAIHHAANSLRYKVDIKWIQAEDLLDAKDMLNLIQGCDGYLIPGGYGERGWEGKILTIKHCRENKIPLFGICFGMQAMAVEFARNVLGLEKANTTEINPDTKYPVISLLSEQRNVKDMGGTMRLGASLCRLKPGSLAQKSYNQECISERHRHRWEFNNQFQESMENAGFIISGVLEGGTLCEIAEIKDHPWMLGVQFHPEFKSKPTDPHPLFKSFIEATIQHKSHGK